ncbi:MAG TPA: protein kinase [Thermoanaerobaculia bacterium]|nr:protein kinase [Thermoanaerobaculia bacterium]
MTIASGSRLGPYEVLSPLGSGGMGEVYRARDSRLAREVAIKVLPASFSNDPDRLRRFEQEAKAAGLLNHPNITAVYDIGTHDGAPYVVSELLEGETLRADLAGGRLSPRKAIDYALQIAHGLAAAHEKGIVHRDLKPENLFITMDGRVKILDFGLAKLTHAEEGAGQKTNLPTATAGTEPGVVLGTLGYMSPEQVRGKPADVRSDLFSFGAILYEMLSGKRAFQGDSAADTMSAILREDPPDLSLTNQNLPLGLERIVRHCLEKNPEQRFYSAHDLAFDLEALSGLSGPRLEPPARAVRPRQRLVRTIAFVAIAAALGLLAGRQIWKKPAASPPAFRRLTFRRGFVSSARFGPDGHTVFYAASWDGTEKPQLFSTRVENPGALRLALPDGIVEAVSRTGEMLLLHDLRFSTGYARVGTLAQAPLSGGAPRDLLEDVADADWSPDDARLAVVRAPGWRYRLEFPAGKILYETSGWISHPRVSPTGDAVAFLDHPIFGDDRGSVAVVDRAGKRRTLSDGWESEQGLVWSPSGEEIWFTATASGTNRALQVVTLSGRRRVITSMAGTLTLQDIARDGRILVDHSNSRIGLLGLSAGQTKEQDLSGLDWSRTPILSEDGKTLIFTEEGEGGGAGYSVFLRKMDGSPPVRLGEGEGLALSPDGKWVLSALVRFPLAPLVLLPTGAGEARPLPKDSLNHDSAPARFFPNGRRVLFTGSEPGHARRAWVQDLEGGKPRPVTPEGVVGTILSPDGRFVLARGPDQKYALYPMDSGPPRPLEGFDPNDRPLQWTADGSSVYVIDVEGTSLTARVFRVGIPGGHRELWKEFTPRDPTGVQSLGRTAAVTGDGKTFVFTYSHNLSDLYAIEGLK